MKFLPLLFFASAASLNAQQPSMILELSKVKARNSIQNIEIKVHGSSPGEGLILTVYRYIPQTNLLNVKTFSNDQYDPVIERQDVPQTHQHRFVISYNDLPEGNYQWAATVTNEHGYGARALFNTDSDQCALLESIPIFGKEHCKVNLLPFLKVRDAIEWHQDGFELAIVDPKTLNIKRLQLKEKDITGYFWINDHKILFTTTGNQPGLYEVDLNTNRTRMHLSQSGLSAPFTLPNGQEGYLKEEGTLYKLYVNRQYKRTFSLKFGQWFFSDQELDRIQGLKIDIGNTDFQFIQFDTHNWNALTVEPSAQLFHRSINIKRNLDNATVHPNMAMRRGKLKLWLELIDENDQRTPLTDQETSFAYLPSWSPDGSTLAFLIKDR